MTKQNDGVRAYQEAQRQETLAKIDEAYEYLKPVSYTHLLASSAASSTDSRPFLTSSISVLILPSLKLSSLMPWLRLS